VGVLIAVIWVLSLIIMAISFMMINHERKKEFAVLRVLGASRKKLSGVVLREALLLTGAGSILGVLLTLLIAALFSDTLTAAIGVPFLLPTFSVELTVALITILATMIAGALTSAISARSIAKQDTGIILRGDD
ncbi:MAG: FtsX-like permease family protein, partial [Ruminococcus sp.]|nr:FtsX-like permease family protein [Ruminococcus sp.]